MTSRSWTESWGKSLFKEQEVKTEAQSQKLNRPKEWYCGRINPVTNEGEISCCLSHLVGLAKHPDTMKELGMMPYQIQLQDLVMKRKGIKLHVNKGRQMGFTETFLRIIQDQCFERYAGKKVILMAGTRFKTTKDIYRRFRELWQNIEYNIREEGSDEMTLHNGCQIMALPASPEAITGLTKSWCSITR
jgi:hypothetical protein